MGDVSIGEMAAIAVFAILLYGRDLPGVARKAAGLYSKVRRRLADLRDEVVRQIPEENLGVALESSGLEPPAAPRGLEATAAPGQVSLAWDVAERATGYTIRRSCSSGGPRLTVAADLESPSFVDTDLQEGVSYTYVVTASNAAGESGESSEATVTILGEKGEGSATGSGLARPQV